ncbi:MAG: hypothetical protein J0L61_09370, partial [Planctomycetes bacterium]|nr:hypothetical protein [Planctomycetota bacterium]
MLREVALSVIVLGAVVRLVSTHSRMPWWEVDPSREFLVETTLRPSQGLMLDAAVWLAAAVGTWASVAAGDRLRWKSAVLVLLGAFGAVVMSQRFVRAGTGPDDVFLGSAWAAAMVGAWAVTQVSSGLSSRRVVVGLAAAFGGVAFVLAGKGVYQVLVEHAQTVAQYKANAAAMLTAQGIEPGSAGAREFERRLMQAEATGWVGLSNAHASILSA